jgi:hypothetical protein
MIIRIIISPAFLDGGGTPEQLRFAQHEKGKKQRPCREYSTALGCQALK